MPYQDARGTWISDDGRSYWNGSSWQPAAPAAPVAAPPAPQYVSPPPPQPAAPIAYAPAPGYIGGPPVTRGSALPAWALGLGIFSLIAWLLPLVGLPVSVVAVVLGGTARGRGAGSMATWGLVLGIIGLVLSLINAAAGVYLKLSGTT